MKYFLAILFLLIFAIIIRKWKFVRSSKLNLNVLYLIFGLKVLFGLLYAQILLMYYGGGDPYMVFKGGNVIFSSIYENPAYYFRLLFGPNGGYIDIPIYKYAFAMEYWDHDGFYNIARFHALIRPITFGYYSIHILFMSFLMFVAGIHYYNLFSGLYPEQRIPLLIVIFTFPSLLFWTGGIHKDGFVYLGIGLCLYHIYKLSKGIRMKNLIFALMGVVIVYMVRDYLMVLLLPPLILLYITLKYPERSFLKFTVIYLVGFVCLLLFNNFLPVNVMDLLADKQSSFLMETGGSDFNVRSLEPTAIGLLYSLPSAILTGFFRPFLWDSGSLLIIMASLGTIFFWIILLCATFFRNDEFRMRPLLCFLFFYGLSNVVMVGLLLSNTGTLVRYRALALNFLLIIAAIMIDWGRVRKLMKRNV